MICDLPLDELNEKLPLIPSAELGAALTELRIRCATANTSNAGLDVRMSLAERHIAIVGEILARLDSGQDY